MTCTVAPFDKIRTRLMNQPPGERLYNNFFDCFFGFFLQFFKVTSKDNTFVSRKVQ